jgi:alpha-L-rhamnosidase
MRAGLEPGFARVRLAPHLGTLKQASGQIPHPNGELRVRYAQDATGAWTAEVSQPPNTPGGLVWQGKTYPIRPGETKVFKL